MLFGRKDDEPVRLVRREIAIDVYDESDVEYEASIYSNGTVVVSNPNDPSDRFDYSNEEEYRHAWDSFRTTYASDY